MVLLCTSASVPPPALFGRYTQQTPGVSVAVLRHGKVVYARGFGSADLRFGLPIDASSRFNIASLGKQLTAFAVYHLSTTGRLRLNDTARSYLPELPDYAAGITVRELLWQTSGLRDYIELAALAGHQLGDAIAFSDVERLMQMQSRLDFAPGSRYEYSNTNYALLAEIVHRVSGMSFSRYCANVIFTPLHMRATSVREGAGTIYPRLASSYWPAATGYVEVRDGSSVVGDGDVITTPTDFAAWERELLHPSIDPQAMRLLKEPSRLSDGSPARPGIASALEVQEGPEPSFRFDGGSAGFRSIAVAYPQRDGAVIVFSNLIVNSGEAEERALAHAFLGVPDEPPQPAQTPVPSPAHGTLADLQSYAGAYHSTEVDRTLFICPQNGGLVARQAFSPDVALSPESADVFSGSMWWLSRLQFTRDSSGRIAGARASTFRAVHGVQYDRVSSSCALP